MVGKINEKINVTAFEQVSAPLVAEYIHSGNRAGVLVGLSQSSDDAYAAGRSTQDKEVEIAKELARQEGKPEAMLDKIAMGRLNKFFKEQTLVNQQFVKDNKKTVKQYLSETEKGLEAVSFKHITLVDCYVGTNSRNLRWGPPRKGLPSVACVATEGFFLAVKEV